MVPVPTAAPQHMVIECGRSVALLELVERRHDEARAGGAHRVAQRDGAAVDVHLVHVDARDGARPAEHHRGEGLVDLDEVDVVPCSCPSS